MHSSSLFLQQPMTTTTASRSSASPACSGVVGPLSRLVDNTKSLGCDADDGGIELNLSAGGPVGGIDAVASAAASAAAAAASLSSSSHYRRSSSPAHCQITSNPIVLPLHQERAASISAAAMASCECTLYCLIH